MFSSINQACTVISKTIAPVVFLDTCTILNSLNSLHDRNFSELYSVEMNELLELNRAQYVHLVTSQTVCEEFKDNINNVAKTAKQAIERIDNNIAAMVRITNSLQGTTHSSKKIGLLRIDDHLTNLSHNILNTCIHLERDDKHTLRAMDRVRANIAPAKKGKSEPKDCEIIECFLDLSKRLRANNFAGKIIFMSANKADFGETGKLKAPLDNQFACVNAELISNPSHLLHTCKN